MTCRVSAPAAAGAFENNTDEKPTVEVVTASQIQRQRLRDEETVRCEVGHQLTPSTFLHVNGSLCRWGVFWGGGWGNETPSLGSVCITKAGFGRTCGRDSAAEALRV